MIVPSTLHGNGVAALLGVAALAGWAVVLATLRRGLRGPDGDAAVAGHIVTLVLIMLHGIVLGHGLLPMVTTATGTWWGLLLATGFRPERIVDSPAGLLGALTRLGAWLGFGGVISAAGYLLVMT
jgi:hypothetical protein